MSRPVWRCSRRRPPPSPGTGRALLLQLPLQPRVDVGPAEPDVAVGLPATLRFYDLRHTAASLLIREGASVKAVQRQLGHATASITLDTYGHLFPDELDALATRLEDLHGRALEARRAAGVWPHGGPDILTLREGAGR